MSERVLFCRVCWMEHYHGIEREEHRPRHGGRWIADGETPCESRNFEELNGNVYGYARPAYHDDRANPRLIDPAFRSGYLENVRVIFFAKQAGDQSRSRQVIVGWYSRARVWEHVHHDLDEERDDLSYLFSAAVDDAFLLPPEQREFVIPFGKDATGQSNWTYPLYKTGKPKKFAWMRAAVQYTIDREARVRGAVVRDAPSKSGAGSPLSDKVEGKREIRYDEMTVEARLRHNKLSNALKRLFGAKVLEAHSRPFYDALVLSSSAVYPDVLIEIKPDLNDRDALRMAIGQLYDYAYELDQQGRPRVLRAALGGCAPGTDEQEILRRAGVDALWTEGDKTPVLRGTGRSLEVLSKLLLRKQSGSQSS